MLTIDARPAMACIIHRKNHSMRQRLSGDKKRKRQRYRIVRNRSPTITRHGAEFHPLAIYIISVTLRRCKLELFQAFTLSLAPETGPQAKVYVRRFTS